MKEESEPKIHPELYRQEAIYSSINDIDFYKIGYELQADIMTDPTKHQAEEENDVIMTFLENQQIGHVGSTTIRELGDFTTDTMIQQWFGRPLRTVSFTWLESDTIGSKTAYAIWQDWATNAYIANKLNNYAFFSWRFKV